MGEEQALKAAPLRLQLKLAGSSAAKLKVAVVDWELEAGRRDDRGLGRWMSAPPAPASERARFSRPFAATFPSSEVLRSTPSSSHSRSSATVAAGLWSSSRAAAPETWGAAIEVPWR